MPGPVCARVNRVRTVGPCFQEADAGGQPQQSVQSAAASDRRIRDAQVSGPAAPWRLAESRRGHTQ